MFFKPLALLPLLALAAEKGIAAPAAGKPDFLPAISPGFDYEAMEKGFVQNLPMVEGVVAHVGGSKIPLSCKTRAIQAGLNPADFDVFTATFSDCSIPWIMCRHINSKITSGDMFITFGKMPLAMREFVKHVIVVPSKSVPGMAAGSFDDSIMFSDGSYRMYIFAHEISHSLDSRVPVADATPPGQGGFSITSKWQGEFAKDKAAVSDYGRSAWPENLAESGVVALFDSVVPGGLKAVHPRYQDVSHQVETYKMAYRDIINPKSKPQCTMRQPDSPMVLMGDPQNTPIKLSAFHVNVMENITMIPPGVPLDFTCSLPHSH